ncbi:MAG: PBECR2 nuclease fold domain-containing protein [Anaerolineae bacterium]
MRDEAPVVPLCSSLEAFEVFSRYVEKGLSDFAGQPIEIDYGNYTHIMEDEERLERAPWVGPTVGQPDEVWLLPVGSVEKQWRGVRRRTYLKRFRPSPDSPEELFAVGLEQTASGKLRLRTCFKVRYPARYVENLRQRGGERIWPSD